MENILLEVIRQKPDDGKQTLGDMILSKDEYVLFNCKTLELPFKGNMKRVSCIPVGEYDCEKVPPTVNIPYNHIHIKEVKGRSGICIHKANFVIQLEGCIAVGKQHIDINHDGYKDVTDSGNTFEKLMSLLPVNFKLNIS